MAMDKIPCLLLKRKINVKDCQPLRHSSNCQVCPLKDRIKPNPYKAVVKPKHKSMKEKTPVTPNELPKIKAGMSHNHPTSIAGAQEAFRKQFEEDNSPITLMLAFNHAVEYATAIPQWVQNRIYQAFDLYMSSHNASLDILLGCKKRGPHTAKERFETKGRNIKLMTAMDMLIRQGLRVEDAALAAHDYIRNQGDYTPNPDKVRTAYYSGWNKRLQTVTEYPSSWVKEVLQSTTEKIRKRYPDIFNSII
jgi:hypothetical protein